jgi:hypothetical protein
MLTTCEHYAECSHQIKGDANMADSDEVKGRARGGKARAKSLTKEELRESGRRAAQARWSGETALKVLPGDLNHPLRIGDIEIPCYVLEGEIRVLSQRAMISGLGMGTGDDRLAAFVGGKGITPYVSSELSETIKKPIRFAPPHGGRSAFGYPATILADICDAVLAARKDGALLSQQLHIADQCEILLRGFARVGIIALVDEATGYQADRAKDALARILEEFVAKELQPYIPTFPDDYYHEMFRLRGLSFPNDTVKRPQYFGTLTNDVIYKRLAPGVLEELKKITPKNESGRHKNKLFQRLTTNTGYPKLREHLGRVIGTMENSKDWPDFKAKLDKKYPRFDTPSQYTFELNGDDDDGKGL